MKATVYFDTSAFRIIAETFRTRKLRDDLRDKIALSPITAVELMSQLTLSKGAQALERIHALRNLVDRQHAAVLPWTNNGIATMVYGVAPADEKDAWFIEDIRRCLAAESVDELRSGASKMKAWLDDLKDTTTAEFKHAIKDYRCRPQDLRTDFAAGLAQRANVKPDLKPVSEVVAAMGAYFEFEEAKLREAVNDHMFKIDKNDVMDAEQLIYLGDPRLNFVTNDKGFLRRVRNSPQRTRIHWKDDDELRDGDRFEAALELMTAETVEVTTDK